MISKKKRKNETSKQANNKTTPGSAGVVFIIESQKINH
jgi:hypothetical protein